MNLFVYLSPIGGFYVFNITDSIKNDICELGFQNL
jgi:hypothetical protein